MTSGALSDIEKLVASTFENAHKTGDVIFEESTTVEQLIDGCSYQVRYVPGLGKKLENDDAEIAAPYKKTMHVCDLHSDGSYAVLLNKFPITNNHFLLVQHESTGPSVPLTADNLSLAYQIIRNHKQRKLVAFFNCGEGSGASQQQKHLQFFPVFDSEPPIDVYLRGQNHYEEAGQLSQVPWAHFLVALQPPAQLDELGDYLMNKFIQLLDEMFAFKQGKELDGAKASYNVLITRDYMHMIPRSKGEFALPNGSKVSVSGINYAGILVVKHEDDLAEVKNVGVTNVLLSVGRKKDEE